MTKNSLFDLNNKVALVTGSAQQIGKTIAHTLASFGAKVAIIDNNFEKALETKEEFAQEGFECEVFVADVTSPEDIRIMIENIINKWGKLDIAFNNVGGCYGHPAEDIPHQDWDHLFKINLDATFYCCQEEAKVMQKVGYGKIINTASIAGVVIPRPQKITAYNTAKAAVIQLTRSLAVEWAEYGIRVNSISPGVIHVPQFETEEMQPWVKQWRAQIPLQRLAELNDLRGIVALLSADSSDYITGQNFIIDGGYSLC